MKDLCNTKIVRGYSNINENYYVSKEDGNILIFHKK
jgi:hypothetical protein